MQSSTVPDVRGDACLSRPIERLLVLGCGGAGKSSLARRLGETLGLPVIHLDAHYWKPGWTATPDEEWRIRVGELVRSPRWIIDGNFSATLDLRLAAADTAVFLDLPRYVCLWRILLRYLRYRNVSRPDMAAGCLESIDMEFLRWVWEFPQRSRPKVVSSLEQWGADRRVFRLRSAGAVARFVEDLRRLTRGVTTP